ncbi:MAG: hypothetical protein RIS17_113, partial [Pseudomonadota bacterium]
MKHLLTLGLLAAAVSAASQPTLPVAMSCSVEDAVDAGKISNLHGLWDFLMVPRGMPSFGLMS